MEKTNRQRGREREREREIARQMDGWLDRRITSAAASAIKRVFDLLNLCCHIKIQPSQEEKEKEQGQEE